MVCTIAERDIDDSVRADLRDTGDATRFEELAQTSDEGRGGGRRCAGVLGDVGAKAGVNDELAAVIRLCELEEEDSLEDLMSNCSLDGGVEELSVLKIGRRCWTPGG